MGDRESSKQAPKLEVLQTVRCLGCGAVYSKPARGGTVTVNPGCPDCGYLGWLDHLVGYRTCAAAPLRRGSPAASLGVTRLTPPKKWCCAGQTRTSSLLTAREAPTVCVREARLELHAPAGGVEARARPPASLAGKPSSRTPASDLDQRAAKTRPAGRADRELHAAVLAARRWEPSCCPSAHPARVPRGRDRPRPACCSGAGRDPVGSRPSRGRGWW